MRTMRCSVYRLSGNPRLLCPLLGKSVSGLHGSRLLRACPRFQWERGGRSDGRGAALAGRARGMTVPTKTRTRVVANNVEMMVCIVATEGEFQAAQEQAKALGLRLAIISNTGLPAGQARLRFLPKSAFTDEANYAVLSDSYGLKLMEPEPPEAA